MNLTREAAMPITAHDRRALRNADRIVFRMLNGMSTIEAYRAAEYTSDGFEARHTVDCDSGIIHYGRDAGTLGRGERARAESYNGFVHWGSVKFTGRNRNTWPTLVDAMAVGATVTLDWTMGNDNDNTRGVGWRRDELHMTVTPAKGKPRTYLIAVEVGPVNSASMMRCSA